MSEHAPKNHESSNNSPEIHSNNKRHESIKKHHEDAPEASVEQQKELLDKIRHEVANSASSSQEKLQSQHSTQAKTVPQPRINKELKNLMFERTLIKVQKQLGPTKKTFSKFIHKESVEAISSVGEKTIARPFGILGGGFLALLGSLFSTYLSKQFGMKYNLIVFALLFFVGYMVSCIIEIIFLFFKKARR
jgi:hypothetical protein